MKDKSLEHNLQAFNDSAKLIREFKNATFAIYNNLLEIKSISAISFVLLHFINALQIFHFIWDEDVLCWRKE